MRALLFASAASQLPAAALCHGSMYEPPNRASRGVLFQDPSCAGSSCLYFNQGTSIGCPKATGDNPTTEAVCKHPAEPTITQDMHNLITYPVQPPGVKDWTKTHPWRKPGSAPIEDPCGLAGGWYTVPGQGNTTGFDAGGGDAPPGSKQGQRGSELPKLLRQTVWVAGSITEVAWGSVANHGGGYQYRLCPAGEKLEEKCFQKLPLEFIGHTSWIQYGHGRDVNNRTEIPAEQVSVGTIPEGSTWRRNPIPACGDTFTGGAFNGAAYCSKPQFPAPIPGLYGFGMGSCFANFVGCTKEQFAHAYQQSQLGVVDKVRVPDVPPGDYVVSFRWDSEQTPQVWNQCGDVKIVAPGGKPSTLFKIGNGCDVCCGPEDNSQGFCANCTKCVGVTTGDCAYCHTPVKYVPVRPRYNLPVTCLGHEAADGGAPTWQPGDSALDWLKGWSPGCPKCWATQGACTAGLRE